MNRMYTVNVRANGWHMVHEWGVNFFHNLTFVYSYKIMPRLQTV